MIEGVDVSKYQPASAIDGYDFAILNVEDPGFANKALHCVELGIPWDIYKWCYPGQSGGHTFNQALVLVQAADIPGRQPGYWLDYEEAGVTANQVGEWFAAADNAGVQSGWYTYLYVLNGEGNHAPDRPLWLAYYPGSNDGSYDSNMSTDARRAGAKIHQYTSTNGTLDKNVVLDEAWWTQWTGTTGGDDMPLNQEDKDWIQETIRVAVTQATNSTLRALIDTDLDGNPSDRLGAYHWDTRNYIVEELKP